MTKHIVTLTYETTVILECESGSGRDWERETALTAESYLHPSRMELTDWDIREASPSDKRPADNV